MRQPSPLSAEGNEISTLISAEGDKVCRLLLAPKVIDPLALRHRISMARVAILISFVSTSVYGRCNPESMLLDISEGNQYDGLQARAGNLHFLPQVRTIIHSRSQIFIIL